MKDKYDDEPPPRLPPSPEEWETMCRRAEKAEAVVREMLACLMERREWKDINAYGWALAVLQNIVRRHGLEVDDA